MLDSISPRQQNNEPNGDAGAEDGQRKDVDGSMMPVSEDEGREEHQEAHEEEVEAPGAEFDDQDGMDTGADAEEEAERPRGLRDPGRPSKSDIEEHEFTHIPFRPWCRA